MAGLLLASWGEKARAAEGADAPKVHEIKKGSLDPGVELDVMTESAEMAPLSLEPKNWSDLSVLEAVPHGTKVRQGDVVLRLDPEKIDEKIEEDERSRAGAMLALELAEAELGNLEKTTPLKLAAAKRNYENANEEYNYFEQTDRAEKQKATRFNVKSAEERLANANEELEQLQKMYDADDLTEETEEIILKRQKFAVESSQYSLDRARLMMKRSLEVLIPREYESLKATRMEQDLAYELSKESLPRNLEQKRLAVEKMRRDRQQADEKLAELKQDRELFTVEAPFDGLVYYGDCDQGKWTTGPAVMKKLQPGGKIGSREVFMTLVRPDKLQLRAVVPEAKLGPLKKGMKGTAFPVSFPEAKLETRLRDLSYIPLPGGGFEALLSIQPDAEIPLYPGMNCKVTLGGGDDADRLIAPETAVFGKGEEAHVFVAQEGGEPRKQMVKLGEAKGGRVEILEGLAEGDKILLEKP